MCRSHIRPSLPDHSPEAVGMPAREAWPELRLHSLSEPQIPAGSLELTPAPPRQTQNPTAPDKKATHLATDDSGYVLFATLRRMRKRKKWKWQSLPPFPLRKFRARKVPRQYVQSMVPELPRTAQLENPQR